MEINLAILDSDAAYLLRLSKALSVRFGEKLVVHTFTSEQNLEQIFCTNKIDVLLLNEDVSEKLVLPHTVLVAYLVDKRNIESINGNKAICKYQKLEKFYREVVGMCSENDIGNYQYLPNESNNTKLISFISSTGGVGTSTIAAGFCHREASLGKKVFYLNLEQFGSSKVFFSGEGNGGLSKIIFAIKCKKSNFSAMLESCVSKDRSGVYFFEDSNLALDLFELTEEEVHFLISELTKISVYDYIVIDMNYHLESKFSSLVNMFNKIFIVSSESQIAQVKIRRMLETLRVLEKQKGESFIDKVSQIINKVSENNESVQVSTDEVSTYARIKLLNDDEPNTIAMRISKLLP